MRLQRFEDFGYEYALAGDEIDFFATLKSFFKREESIVLSLKQTYALSVREDMLILFVRIYILRFAIPYFQILNYRFPSISDVIFLQKILYSCLIGRFVDDLVDNDSKIFMKSDSIILLQHYNSLFESLIEPHLLKKFCLSVANTTKYKSPIYKDIIFDHIKTDIYQRIEYFFIFAEESNEESKVEHLKVYTSILLAELDLKDAIADGFRTESATAISNCLYSNCFNDEGKLLLDGNFFSFHRNILMFLKDERQKLDDYLVVHNLRGYGIM